MSCLLLFIVHSSGCVASDAFVLGSRSFATLLRCFSFLGFHMVWIARGILCITHCQLKQIMLPSVFSVWGASLQRPQDGCSATCGKKKKAWNNSFKIRSIYCSRGNFQVSLTIKHEDLHNPSTFVVQTANVPMLSASCPSSSSPSFTPGLLKRSL